MITNQRLFTIIQKLLVVLLSAFVALPAVADDGIILRECRKGKATLQQVQARSRALLRRGAENDNPYTGKRRQLVVLASFQDRSFQDDETTTLLTWEKIFNQENFSEGQYVGSVHDYFYAQSYGQFDLSFDLQYVTLGAVSRYASTKLDDENSQFLVYDIVDSLSQRTIDWSLYDWNEDGEVEQLLIVYAGLGMNEGASNCIWPHQYWLSFHVDPTTGEFCTKDTVIAGGREYTIDSYCAVQERGSRTNPFGTLCHEYTHCFGFPDFYAGGMQIVGAWDLMDYGCYNGNGYCPCGYSAHERMLLGWMTPTELFSKTTVTAMSALSDEPEAYLVRSDLHRDEYYILENRQQKGWDANLPGSGILVFHIDYDHSSWYDYDKTPNTYYFRRYDLFHANNSDYSSGGWGYPYGSNHALTDSSNPAATLLEPVDDTSEKLMSKPITQMSVSDGLASFLFMDENETAVEEVSLSQSPAVLYELGNILIIRDGNGNVKKVLNNRKKDRK